MFMTFEDYYEDVLKIGTLRLFSGERWEYDPVNILSAISYLGLSIFLLFSGDFIEAMATLSVVLGFAIHSPQKQLIYQDGDSIVFRDITLRSLVEEFLSRVKSFTKIDVEGLLAVRFGPGTRKFIWFPLVVLFGYDTATQNPTVTAFFGDNALLVTVLSLIIAFVKFWNPWSSRLEIETVNSTVQFRFLNPNLDLVEFLLKKIGR